MFTRRFVALVASLLLLVGVVPVAAMIVVTPPGVTCGTDTRLTTPVQGQDFCFESTTNSLNVWDGAAWVRVTVVGGSVPSSFNARTGLTTSNNVADATNDIDIQVGLADSDDAVVADRQQMSLTSILTKRIDAAWVVGTNQGGLDTGAVADDTYHIFLIKRTDTGVVDALFSLSPTSPTMPTGYTKKRRIASVLREGGVLIPYLQDGKLFMRVTPTLDVSDAAPGTSAKTGTLKVPTGIRVLARVNARGPSGGHMYLSDLASADLAASATLAPLGTVGDTGAVTVQGPIDVMTNTAAQIRYRSNTNVLVAIATLGWIDLGLE